MVHAPLVSQSVRCRCNRDEETQQVGTRTVWLGKFRFGHAYRLTYCRCSAPTHVGVGTRINRAANSTVQVIEPLPRRRDLRPTAAVTAARAAAESSARGPAQSTVSHTVHGTRKSTRAHASATSTVRMRRAPSVTGLRT